MRLAVVWTLAVVAWCATCEKGEYYAEKGACMACPSVDETKLTSYSYLSLDPANVLGIKEGHDLCSLPSNVFGLSFNCKNKKVVGITAGANTQRLGGVLTPMVGWLTSLERFVLPHHDPNRWIPAAFLGTTSS